MGFFLFLLVNATLFIRPAEVLAVKEFENVYQYLILACLALSLPDVLGYLTNRLDTKPIALGVLGVLLCVPLAFLGAGDLAEAFRHWFYFFKVVVYFLLLVSLVNTPGRIATFVACVVFFAMVLTILVVLNYHQVIELQNVKVLKDTYTRDPFEQTGTTERLQGTGVFQDPNEMGVILACLTPLCLFALTAKRGMLLKPLWLAGLVLFAYAIHKTQSRGAFLALVAGLGAFSWARFGPRVTFRLALVGLPLLAVFFAGRQLELNVKEGTASTRISHWSDWLWTFRGSPLLGAGMPLAKEDMPEISLSEERDLLAHNSFIQAFADMGVAGGMFFFGSFMLAVWSTWRLGRGTVLLDPTLRRLQPYLFGFVVAYIVGLCTLSICYVVPTYFVLGTASAFATAAAVMCYPAKPALRVDGPLLGRVALASVCYLAAAYIVVRLFNTGA